MASSCRQRGDDGSFRQRVGVDVENAFSPEREVSFRERSSSPELGMRALRGQSGFNEGRAAESGFGAGSGGGGGSFQFRTLTLTLTLSPCLTLSLSLSLSLTLTLTLTLALTLLLHEALRRGLAQG